jgi:hypothetical protein
MSDHRIHQADISSTNRYLETTSTAMSSTWHSLTAANINASADRVEWDLIHGGHYVNEWNHNSISNAWGTDHASILENVSLVDHVFIMLVCSPLEL